jgi:uncharacterized membrane protein HdeD (DUF308 family)
MSGDPFMPTSLPGLAGLENLRKNWWLMLLMGIAIVLIGTFAVIWACTATIATIFLFGVLLCVGGVLQIIEAFYARGWGGFFLSVLFGILYVIVGLLIIEHPVAAAAGLTLMIGAALIVGGLVRIVIAVLERFSHWGWVLLNGIITLVLGIMIWRRWPEDTLWIIGLFVGIEMIFCGWTWVMLALALRSAPRSAP